MSPLKEEKIFCTNGEVTKVKTVKHYPPDTAAVMAWLNNRRPDQFRSKQYVESNNVNLNLNDDVSGMTEAELDEIIKNRK